MVIHNCSRAALVFADVCEESLSTTNIFESFGAFTGIWNMVGEVASYKQGQKSRHLFSHIALLV